MNDESESMEVDEEFSSQHVSMIVSRYQQEWKEGGDSQPNMSNLYQGFTNFDPFQSCPYDLRKTEQALMHHCNYPHNLDLEHCD